MAKFDRQKRRMAPALRPLALALSLHFSAALPAATIVVDDASEGSVAGKCTLADAVSAVNTATALNGCIAGDGNNDTIDLSGLPLPASITFSLPTSADGKSAVALTKPATLRGALDASHQPRVTLTRSAVSGTPNFRLIASSADLSVDSVAISGGSANGRGGAVYASGNAALTVVAANISGNVTAGYSGGGVASYNGSITITGSTLTGNVASLSGGAVYTNGGDVTLSNSLVSGNHANAPRGGKYSHGGGGGVFSFNGAHLNAYGTTFSGNTAPHGYGGGIAVFHDAKLVNSTIANNNAEQEGGGAIIRGNLTMSFCTVAGNLSRYLGVGSAVVVNQTATVNGTISINNGYGPYNIDNFDAGTMLGSNNIIAPSFGSGTGNACDTKLGPLADNGGLTPTMALYPGSCAINAGPTVLPAGVAVDQRGLPRMIGFAADVGAFEVQNAHDPPDVIFHDGFDAG